MAVYNGRPHLAAALASLAAQTLGEWELIAVDDGSTDGSREELLAWAAREPRITVLDNETNRGLPASLNRALPRARGRFVARLDADDVALPRRLARQAAFLAAHPATVILGGWVAYVDEAGRPLGLTHAQPAGDAAIRAKLLLNNAFHHSTVMLRRKTLTTQGLAYDPAFRYAQDYDLWSRLLAHGQGANLPEVLVQFRRHGGQVSTAHAAASLELADQVAWRNVTAAGLDREFNQEEVRWARRAGLVLPGQTARERRLQYFALAKILAALGRRFAGPDPDWEGVRRAYWQGLRHALRHWPRDAATARVLAGVVRHDPAASLAEAWAFLTRRRSTPSPEEDPA